MKETVGSMWVGWVELQSAAAVTGRSSDIVAATAPAAAAGLHNNKGGCWFIVGRVA